MRRITEYIGTQLGKDIFIDNAAQTTANQTKRGEYQTNP